MKYIKAVLVFMIPKDRLSEQEKRDWDAQFEELRHEIAEDAPDGVTATLVVEEVDEESVEPRRC